MRYLCSKNWFHLTSSYAAMIAHTPYLWRQLLCMGSNEMYVHVHECVDTQSIYPICTYTRTQSSCRVCMYWYAQTVRCGCTTRHWASFASSRASKHVTSAGACWTLHLGERHRPGIFVWSDRCKARPIKHWVVKWTYDCHNYYTKCVICALVN